MGVELSLKDRQEHAEQLQAARWWPNVWDKKVTRRFHTEADGNCFFISLSYTAGLEISPQSLRAEVCTFAPSPRLSVRSMRMICAVKGAGTEGFPVGTRIEPKPILRIHFSASSSTVYTDYQPLTQRDAHPSLKRLGCAKNLCKCILPCGYLT